MYLWCFFNFLFFRVIMCIKNCSVDMNYCVICCNGGFYIV